jgi:hypothetical protein
MIGNEAEDEDASAEAYPAGDEEALSAFADDLLNTATCQLTTQSRRQKLQHQR